MKAFNFSSHAVIECSQLNTPDNGFATFSPDTTAPYSFTTTVTYGCGSGFGLSGGDGMRTCVSSSSSPGEWSGTAPTCEGISRLVYVITMIVSLYYSSNV